MSWVLVFCWIVQTVVGSAIDPSGAAAAVQPDCDAAATAPVTQQALTVPASEAELAHKRKVREHYDLISPYYFELWGEHIHHGFWRVGNETKEQAVIQLIEELISHAVINPDISPLSTYSVRVAKPIPFHVLDIGCGVGGTATYLLDHYPTARVTGISLSPKQIEMAKERIALRDAAAAAASTTTGATDGTAAPPPPSTPKLISDRVSFHVMDGEAIDWSVLSAGSYDVVWISEVLSHFRDKRAFFQTAYKLLKPGGVLVLADWFKADALTREQFTRYVEPIEHGMIVPGLHTLHEYIDFVRESGLRLLYAEDVSARVAHTWEIAMDVIMDPTFWELALAQGSEFVAFLNSFLSMRAGYMSRTFVYGLMTAEKPAPYVEPEPMPLF